MPVVPNMQTILQQYLRPVLAQTVQDFELFQQKLGNRISTKLRSEIISALLQNAFAQIVPNARSGTSDREADVYVNGIPLEIKSSHKSREWRGGEFSKRSGDFLLVSWQLSKTNVPTWCCIHAILTEADWRPSSSPKYYATSIVLDDVLAKGTVLIGNTRMAKKRYHPVHENVV